MAALALPAALVPGCVDPAPSFAWQTVLSDVPGALLSVWGSSSRDVYVVGAQGQDGLRGRTWGPPPEGTGECLPLGEVYGEHTLTRPFAVAVGVGKPSSGGDAARRVGA